MSARDDGFERLAAEPLLDDAASSRVHEERIEAASEASLAPRGVGEILDAAFWAMRERFVPLVLGTTLLWLPIRLAMYELSSWVDGVPLAQGSPDVAMLRTLSATAGVLFVSGVAYAVSMPFAILIAHGEIVGPRADAWGALARAAKIVLGTFVISLVVGMASIVGCLALVVGIVVAAWLFSCALPAFAVERKGIGHAIQRTLALTRGSDWAASFGRWVAISVVAWLLTSPLSQAATFADDAGRRATLREDLSMSPGLFAALYIPLTALFIAVSTAGTSAATASYYADRRVRRDGLDLRLELDRIRRAHGERA